MIRLSRSSSSAAALAVGLLLSSAALAQTPSPPGGSASGGSGTVTSISGGNGILPSTNPCTATCTLNTTVTNNAQTGTSYATLATDGGTVVSGANSSAKVYTLPVASTTGYTTGFGLDYYDIGAGGLTITATSSIFDNALNSVVMTTGQDAYVWSDGANYHAALSMPISATGSILGNTSGASNYPTTLTSTNITTLLAANPLVAASGAITTGHCAEFSGTAGVVADSGGACGGSGSGTVNSGTTPDVAYYASSTTAVSDGGTAVVTAGGINVASSTVPANGMYLAGTNSVSFSTNSTARINLASNGTLSAPATNSAEILFGTVSTATTPGIVINKGTTSAGLGGAAGVPAIIVASVTQQKWDGTGTYYGGTIPTVSGTGTPTIATGSTDTAGEVTSGASATSVIITFSATKTNAPFCIVTGQGEALISYSISTTAITIVQSALSSDKIDYNCVQH